MPPDNSIINFGDVSKPVTVLIEKISAAIGVLYEPTRVTRLARAEAEAEKIKTLARSELTDIEQRAIDRFVHQETRKQANIESITAQAAASLPADAQVENLDEDWVAHFFKQCDTVSDQEMQSLWSRLLTGEATKPGTFSKRTVDLVSNIDKKDAELFTSFCQFVWMMGEPTPLIYSVNDEVYGNQGITFAALKHLDSIGLISFESISGYSIKSLPKYAHFFYYGRPTLIEFSADTDNQIEIGHVLLTSAGRELTPICGSHRNEDFYQRVIRQWFDRGLILSSLRP